MSRYSNRSEAILYVWDFFYLAGHPGQGDENSWRRIENALNRVRESEAFAEEPRPADVRRSHVRRIRNGLRVALEQIEQLAERPPDWVVLELEELLPYFEALDRELDALTVLVH